MSTHKYVWTRWEFVTCIRYRTYQMPNLPDTELIRYRTYRISNFPDTELVRYQTYQIPNLSYTEFIRHRTYQIPNLPDSELMRERTYQILNLAYTKFARFRTCHNWIFQILNFPDTELIRCRTCTRPNISRYLAVIYWNIQILLITSIGIHLSRVCGHRELGGGGDWSLPLWSPIRHRAY
jgi:hypothetical protein